MPDVTRGSLDGHGLTVAVVVSRFNEQVTRLLLEGAQAALGGCGVREEDVRVFSVPGAVEIPLVARRLVETGRFDAVVALGAVIRGETSHYDHVCRVAADGCARVSLETGVPVAFGVLTCEDGPQALARARQDGSNKGFEAAQVAVEMANLLRGIGSR